MKQQAYQLSYPHELKSYISSPQEWVGMSAMSSLSKVFSTRLLTYALMGGVGPLGGLTRKSWAAVGQLR